MALLTGLWKGLVGPFALSVRGLGPAGCLVGGVVADECMGDAVGAMGQRAGDDAAGLAAIFEPLGVVLGGRLVEPQADA